ncbi:MAG: hypothetical protein IPM74_03620 [Crocinitomicaceae bacterium]|nr:hypothetical protein [Crocinitomicaceae bacterium]MBK8925002.1 hypothetical protein [Crocinitomicaceae bacterium]
MKVSESNKIRIKGVIKRAPLNKGSKSDQVTIVIDSKKGLFKLRKVGENPFMTTYFNDYLDKTVEIEGFLNNNQFFIESIDVLE